MVSDAALGWVSVVMIASAAAYQSSSFNAVIALGIAVIIFSTGRGSRMTPVEKGKTCSALIPKA